MSRRRFPLLVLAIALVIGATGCLDTTVQYQNGHQTQVGGPGTVAFIGDSITVQSRWALQGHGQGRGWFVNVEATNAAMTRDKQTAALLIAQSPPEVAVVQLGTNDQMCILHNIFTTGCRYPFFGSAELAADLWIMGQTLHRPGVCLVGVTTYFGDPPGLVWDDLLAAGVADGIADWKSVAIAHHGEYVRDEIGHLTAAGEDAYGAFLLDEIGRICR